MCEESRSDRGFGGEGFGGEGFGGEGFGGEGFGGRGIGGKGFVGEGFVGEGFGDSGLADGGLADSKLADGELADGELADGGLNDGGLADSRLADGGLNDGRLNDGGLNDGGLNDGGLNDGGRQTNTDDQLPIETLTADQLADQRCSSLARLLELFQSQFGRRPQFAVKVPGRVNLIGEHVDYADFPVMPMAINRCVLLAVGFRQSCEPQPDMASDELNFRQTNLFNQDRLQYPPFSFANTQFLRERPVRWQHYFACGYRGVLEEAELEAGAINAHAIKDFSAKMLLGCYTLDVAVLGDIPARAGLSSSSALVCASAIAVRRALELVLAENCVSGWPASPVTRLRMAASCARFERRVGTQGGGMDQAIALLAEAGCAKLIEFLPALSARSVGLPARVRFFLAHCGLDMHKAGSDQFNQRVFETRAATAVLRAHYAYALDAGGCADQCADGCADRCADRCADGCADRPLCTLGRLKLAARKSFDELLALVHRLLEPGRAYSFDELLAFLGADSAEQLAALLQLPPALVRAMAGAPGQPRFALGNRALHVLGEAKRVYQARRCADRPEQLAQLMRQSYVSCRELYECSCEQLDRLVSASDRAGALASRITGAGWGGCIVAMVHEHKCAAYLQQIQPHCKFVLQVQPSDGAVVFQLDRLS